MSDYNHKQRVRQELIKVGVTPYGLLKHEARELHKLIHQNEHINAVAYGRSGIDSVMLVATDKRVIYFDRKPFLSDEDEVPYDMVSGVDHGQVGMFATVTLHTRVGDYKIKYANPTSVRKFVDHIEKHRLESEDYKHEESPKPKQPDSALLTSAAQDFLNKHELATLASVDKTGNVHAAVVYYYGPLNGTLYIVTKEETQKAHNIMANRQVALTVYDEGRLQTVQLQGLASLETDTKIKHRVMDELIQPKMSGEETKQPPITKIEAGSYAFIKVVPTSVKFYDYKFKEIKGI